MRDSSAIPEAKEQRTLGLKITETVATFQRYCMSNPQLSDLERAWAFYEGLPLEQQRELREYKSENGEMDFRGFYDRVSYLRPSGIAGMIGQNILKEKISDVLCLSIKKGRMAKPKPYKSRRRN